MTRRPDRTDTWPRRWATAPGTVTAAWGLLLGMGICWPLIGGHPVLLLDWVTGPHAAVASPAVLGLDGGITTGVVGTVVMSTAVRLLGGVATWLPLLMVFPLGAWGAGRLAGGRLPARLAAATVYCANPFVFNRIYAGQLALLFGYAVLPFAVASALRAVRRRSAGLLAPALWWAVLTAISPHYAWIYGLVLVAVAVVATPRTWRSLAWLAANTAAFAVTSLYILLPHSATQLPTRVGTTSLDLYRTTGDPHLGLFPNVLGLYGFWRLGPGPELPKDVVTGWPLLLVALLVVVAAGYWSRLRRPPAGGPAAEGPPVEGPPVDGPAAEDPPVGLAAAGSPGAGSVAEQRRLAWVLVVAGVAGYFLALGSQGPTGALFRWLYDTVPFFAIMREPQKFLMLLALAYATGLGWGVERLAGRRRRTAAAGAGAARAGAGAGPGTARSATNLGHGPHIDSTSAAVPATATDPDDAAAPARPIRRGRRRWRPAHTALAVGVLLPLAYTPTIFDGLAGQIGPSTVPAAYQRADTLMGTGAGRVLYLPWHLYEAQPFTGGRVVATLGPAEFRRRVIAGDNVQVGDVQTQSTSPRSAYLQRLFTQAPAITAFGADVAPLGVQYVVLAKTVDWRSYGWLHHQGDLRLVLTTASLDVWRNLAYRGAGQRTGAAAPVTPISPVAYRVPPGRPGTVTIDAAYQPGWELHGRPGQPTAEGTVRFAVATGAGGVAIFTPWGLVRLGYVLSLAAVAALAVAVAIDRRRQRRLTHHS